MGKHTQTLEFCLLIVFFFSQENSKNCYYLVHWRIVLKLENQFHLESAENQIY